MSTEDILKLLGVERMYQVQDMLARDDIHFLNADNVVDVIEWLDKNGFEIKKKEA